MVLNASFFSAQKLGIESSVGTGTGYQTGGATLTGSFIRRDIFVVASL